MKRPNCTNSFSCGVSESPSARIAQLEAELSEARTKLANIEFMRDSEAMYQRERAAHARTQAEAAATMIALTLLWEWGSTVVFPSDIGRRYLIVAESVISNPPEAGRALAERVTLWRELETLCRAAVISHLPTCPCLRCIVLDKLAALKDPA